MEINKGTIEAVKAIAEAIRELKEVPSGELYARVMNHMSLSTYNSIIDLLVRTKIIENKNHLLRWLKD